MPERFYRNVDLDLDDLADALIEWFEHDTFVVQDFQEGPTILIQARKENLISRLSFTSQALNIRLSPLTRGFKAEVAAGEWLDKGVGAAAAAVAVKFINPLIGIGAAAATGYGIYQQLMLPENAFAFIERFVDEHGVDLGERDADSRRRRGRTRSDGVDDELDELRREVEPRAGTERPASDAGVPKSQAAPGRFCPNCGEEITPGSRFCGACGAKLPTPAGSPPPPPAAATAADDPADGE